MLIVCCGLGWLPVCDSPVPPLWCVLPGRWLRLQGPPIVRAWWWPQWFRAVRFHVSARVQLRSHRPPWLHLVLWTVLLLPHARYHTDPSGTLTPYSAHAIGNGHEGALSLLEDKYSRSMTLGEAELLVARVLRDTMEEKVSATNIQIASVSALMRSMGIKGGPVSAPYMIVEGEVGLRCWLFGLLVDDVRGSVCWCAATGGQVTPGAGFQLYSSERLEALIAALAADPAHST